MPRPRPTRIQGFTRTFASRSVAAAPSLRAGAISRSAERTETLPKSERSTRNGAMSTTGRLQRSYARTADLLRHILNVTRRPKMPTQYVRPLRVFVGHGTKAEKGF